MTRTRCRIAGTVGGLVLITIGFALTARPSVRQIASRAAAGSVQHQTDNGLPSGSADGELRAMMLKYTARCALREGQYLEDAVGPNGEPARRYPGSLGLAPEWLDGACNTDCQERVSSCLIALTNRTGKHVALSLLSNAVGMSVAMHPSADDLPYAHQEGAFFGDVFTTGQAFACRGRGVAKAPQVKRFCAVDPASCSGLADFRDAGRCDDVCEMSCRTLSDGSERCAAVSCRDPGGRVWRSPLTTYLRNGIEAGNADQIRGARRADEALEGLDRGATARFEQVDFGATGGATSRLALTIAPRHRGRIELWLDGRERLGVLPIAARLGGAAGSEEVLVLAARPITGRHAVELRVVDGRDLGRISTIEVR